MPTPNIKTTPSTTTVDRNSRLDILKWENADKSKM